MFKSKEHLSSEEARAILTNSGIDLSSMSKPNILLLVAAIQHGYRKGWQAAIDHSNPEVGW